MIIEEKPPLEEVLAHYGVKGMKWGIRRLRGYALDEVPKSIREEAKRNMKIEGKKVTDRVIDKRFLGTRSLGSIPYSKLSTTRGSIKSGTTLYRITPRESEKIRNLLFVSSTQADRTRYKAVVPSLRGRGGKEAYKQHYEVTYKTLTDLTLPSEKERIDAFNKILDSPTIRVGRRTVTGEKYLRSQGYGRHVNSVHNSRLGRVALEDAFRTQHLDQPLSSAYFNELRSRGFKAVQDDNDRHILANDPVIILKPDGTIKKIKVKKLSNRDITDAQRRFSGDLTTG